MHRGGETRSQGDLLRGAGPPKRTHPGLALTNKMAPPLINGVLVSLDAGQVLHVSVEVLAEPGLRTHTQHTSIKTEKQMTRTTVQRTRSLRTIAAPLIAIALVLTACGSDGPAEDPSIPNTLRGGKGTEY